MSLVINGFDLVDALPYWWDWVLTHDGARGHVDPDARADFFDELALATAATGELTFEHGGKSVTRGGRWMYDDSGRVIQAGGGGQWTYAGDDTAMSLYLCCSSRGRVPVSAECLLDSFGRSEASGWGTSDAGYAWFSQLSGAGTSASVDGSKGTIALTQGGTSRRMTLLNTEETDSRRFTRVYDGLLTLEFVNPAADNTSRCYLNLNDSLNGIALYPGVDFVEERQAPFDSISVDLGSPVKVRWSMSDTELKFKVWPATGTEPGSWQLTSTPSDADTILQVNALQFTSAQAYSVVVDQIQVWENGVEVC